MFDLRRLFVVANIVIAEQRRASGLANLSSLKSCDVVASRAKEIKVVIESLGRTCDALQTHFGVSDQRLLAIKAEWQNVHDIGNNPTSLSIFFYAVLERANLRYWEPASLMPRH